MPLGSFTRGVNPPPGPEPTHPRAGSAGAAPQTGAESKALLFLTTGLQDCPAKTARVLSASPPPREPRARGAERNPRAGKGPGGAPPHLPSPAAGPQGPRGAAGPGQVPSAPPKPTPGAGLGALPPGHRERGEAAAPPHGAPPQPLKSRPSQSQLPVCLLNWSISIFASSKCPGGCTPPPPSSTPVCINLAYALSSIETRT